ncbi:MAG: PIN domain-containing protein [Desulfobacula sp.]|nr:PIN domain-containing protein [Desulfobacula sp.]
MFLLDTNVISEMIKKKPDPRIMAELELHQNKIVTSAPVWHELNFGCNRLALSKKRK